MSIITTLAVASISAYITAVLAVNRFKKEREWERKERAYTTIVKCAKTSIEYNEEYLKIKEATYVSKDRTEGLNNLLEKRDKEKACATQVLNDHHFFLKKSSTKCIQGLLNNIVEADHMGVADVSEDDLQRLKTSLYEIEKIAHRELTISPSHAYITFSFFISKIDLIFKPVAQKIERKKQEV